ncbi:hypothetical protein [Acaryochloris sp. IP29b_bin.148]|uniref:hypothetical protein n=1 Tax=Acaryochloris sp. IP29b_bin.148 TaxID=2969218 RepID=UPI0026111C9B|nr:hypothetical protein [Acaryochloris sp. IP29b_bin.148]
MSESQTARHQLVTRGANGVGPDLVGENDFAIGPSMIAVLRCSKNGLCPAVSKQRSSQVPHAERLFDLTIHSWCEKRLVKEREQHAPFLEKSNLIWPQMAWPFC